MPGQAQITSIESLETFRSDLVVYLSQMQPVMDEAAGEVTHVFTHFPLALTVFVTHVPKTAAAPEGARWVELAHLRDEALPNVMRKVLSAALD